MAKKSLDNPISPLNKGAEVEEKTNPLMEKVDAILDTQKELVKVVGDLIQELGLKKRAGVFTGNPGGMETEKRS